MGGWGREDVAELLAGIFLEGVKIVLHELMVMFFRIKRFQLQGPRPAFPPRLEQSSCLASSSFLFQNLSRALQGYFMFSQILEEISPFFFNRGQVQVMARVCLKRF